jgi:hypothetical protein
MITGTTLSFAKQVPGTPDAMGNSVNTVTNIEVADCLIAPITEPVTAREQQAVEQSKDQVRIHLPKAYTGDVSDSDVVWDGKTFHLDSDAVVFMAENTPGRWNRYLRAEVVNG